MWSTGHLKKLNIKVREGNASGYVRNRNIYRNNNQSYIMSKSLGLMDIYNLTGKFL